MSAGLWTCDAEGSVMTTDANGGLQISTNRGTLRFARPDESPMPEVNTRWSYDGIHEIECTRENCHFKSFMSLDSGRQTESTHKEAALMLFDAFNNYEHDGLWPIAHDEARLAASMAWSLKNSETAPTSDIEPLLAWAMRRNPQLYEAWELAAEFPAGGPLEADGQPTRDGLASRQWYETLSLLRVSAAPSADARKAADAFARENLLATGALKSRPHHRQRLINRLCGALSSEVLVELGDAGQQCELLQTLNEGHGWTDTTADMLEAEFGRSELLAADLAAPAGGRRAETR